jgi:hypothetical protein
VVRTQASLHYSGCSYQRALACECSMGHCYKPYHMDQVCRRLNQIHHEYLRVRHPRRFLHMKCGS